MRGLNNLFKMIVAMVLTIVTISCEKDNGGSGIDSTINISGKKLLTVSSEASGFEVKYSVTGSGAGQAVTAVSDQDWAVVDGSVPGTVSVSVGANLSAEDRTAVITLTLKGAEDAFVTVLQSSDPDYRIDTKQSFALAVTDVEASSAFVTVAPTNSDSYYCYGVVTAEQYSKFNGDGKAFVADYAKQLIDYARKAAEANGQGLSLKNYLTKGYKSHTYDGFTPLSDYYLFAFDMTLGGECSGNVAVKKFTTKKYPDSAPDFRITVDADANVKVVPSDASVTYVLTVDSYEVWSKSATPKACAEDFLKWVEESDHSIRSFMHQGEFSECYYNPKAQMGNLTTGDYVAYAFGYNGSKITTGISYLKFHFDEPKK